MIKYNTYYNESKNEFSISTIIYVNLENSNANINFENFKEQILKNFDDNDKVSCYNVNWDFKN